MSIGCCIDNPSAGGGGGGVTSVSGTANRITSTGGTTPVIDIAANYVGQSSITTLGTITTGIWNGTAIDVTHGGTGTTTQFTQGSVVFAGASGVYSQANSGLFYDASTVRFGVGTASPQVSIHTLVNDSGANAKATIEQAGTGDSALQFLLTGVTAWVIGVDNSDSDKFKIAAANNGFATPALTITTAGVTTLSSALPVGSGGTGLTTGTSGGIPYFSGTTTIASSALLATNNVVVGGGAGNTPLSTGVTIDTNNALYGYIALINAQTGTTYTLASNDTGKIVEISNGSGITLTLPNNLVAGFNCTVVQTGAGVITLSAASGAAFHNRSSFTKTAGQYAMITVYVTTNSNAVSAVYIVGGDGST